MTLKEVRQATTDPNDPNPDDPNPDDPPVDDRQRAERDRGKSKPRGVGEPRATGREISNRIREQAIKAFREGTFGKSFVPSMGFRRRFEQSLHSEGWATDEAASATAEFYERVDRFLRTAVELGPDEYAGVQDFMSLVDRHLESEVERLGRR
jgi:hypothetical protein